MSLMANVDYDILNLKNLLCEIINVVLKDKGIEAKQHCKEIKPLNFMCILKDGEP